MGVVGSGDDAQAIGGMEIICKDNLPYSVEFKENYQEFCKYIPMDNDFAEESKKVAVDNHGRHWADLMAAGLT
ncbi:MAG: hypothetical protein U0X39_02210 [Bacteroidales bacterium]